MLIIRYRSQLERKVELWSIELSDNEGILGELSKPSGFYVYLE